MTYADHARAMAALIAEDRMGPRTRALHESFLGKGSEQCLLETGQVIRDFLQAVEADKLEKMPKDKERAGE